MSEVECRLAEFAAEYRVNTKGPLCLVLVITRNAAQRKPPLRTENFLTRQGGQVAGLGRSAVQAILADHDITRVLAEEGGRTSRGSIRRMRAYVSFLNALNRDGLLDCAAIERWWVARVREHFAATPFRVKMDPAKSVRNLVGELVKAAFARQSECPGTMVAGAMIQHLVGAKLELALPEVTVEHNGFSVADAASGRKGDFLIGDTAIHVTTAPTEGLIRKCWDNLGEGLRPVVITTETGAGGAAALAQEGGIADRIEILEIEQFVTTNIYEWSGFRQRERPVTVRELVKAYNRIVETCETDPSLKISVG